MNQRTPVEQGKTEQFLGHKKDYLKNMAIKSLLETQTRNHRNKSGMHTLDPNFRNKVEVTDELISEHTHRKIKQ
jgi:hypothetical protein